MSAGPRPGRVVVGVSDSPAGLRALWEAVPAARLRGQDLGAVLAYPVPGTNAGYYASAAGLPGGPAFLTADVASDIGPGRPRSPRAECERTARKQVEQAFAMAMGDLPHNLEVSIDARQGPPRRVLLEAAGDEQDLLVVGTTRRSWWSFRRSLSGYLTGHARCPVLVVPPSAAADTFAGHRPLRDWAWRHRALARELSDLSSKTTP